MISLTDAWWRELRRPLMLFVPLAILFAATDIDVSIANALFFDSAQGKWLGAHNWWIESFLHTGGRWAIRGVVAAAIAVWVVSIVKPKYRQLRRPTAYFIVASVLGIGIVGLLKTITNVDCPWDLAPFGGQFPLVQLFADRPDALRHGHCFPAAHASSGYALMTLYFALREHRRDWARIALVFGIVCGVAFGLAQQSRGAHFMSHDLWSAFLIWLVAASVYVFGFSMRLYTDDCSGVADETLCSTRERGGLSAQPTARLRSASG